MLYIYSILSVLIVSLVSFVGAITLSFKDDFIRRYVFVLVSLAVGALLGDAFIHLLPEAFGMETNPITTSILVIIGIILFFVLEKILHFHHEDCIEDGTNHTLGKLVLFSDGVHNFIDGILIGASFLVSIPLGVATTIAVILHEIPQEIGDFGVLLHAGYKKSQALWLNFFSSLSALVGLLFVFLLQQFIYTFMIWLIPLTAGGFIYIALSDLIPELHKTVNWKHSVTQLFAISIGVGAMILLLNLE